MYVPGTLLVALVLAGAYVLLYVVVCDMGKQTTILEGRIMKKATDDIANWRLQHENMSKPFPCVFPQMPPRFRRCRRFI